MDPKAVGDAGQKGGGSVTRWSTTSRTSAAFAVAYVLLFLLYGYVGYTSPGYDDEFFNIRWIEGLGVDAIGLAQQRDVNPPGSYAVNWVLYSLLGNWSLVRLAVALFAASTIVYAIFRVRRSSGDVRGFMAVTLLGLSPALLMWTTGLRWYAIFVPVLLLLSFPPRPDSWRYWGTFFAGLLILGYLSYAMFIVAIPLGYLYWRGDPRPRSMKVKQIALFGLVFAALYGYQMWVFITTHLARQGSQRFSLLEGLVGFAVSELSNHGVFPLSLGGAASIAGTFTVLVIIGLTSLRENTRDNPLFVPYWAGVLLLIVSGLAGKFRNFVVVAPWQGLFISQAIVPAKWRRTFAVGVALISLGNVIGAINVATHSNTSKSNWNLPLSQVLTILNEENLSCDSDIVVAAHDPTLTYTLEARGYDVVSLWSTRTDLVAAVNRVPECVVLLKTYSGSREGFVLRLQSAVDAINAADRKTQRIGFDSAYATKRRIEPDYPQYQVEVVTLRQPTDLKPLQQLLPPRARNQDPRGQDPRGQDPRD